MTDERYKQIMNDLGMVNSQSLLSALRQVANEAGQEAMLNERKACNVRRYTKQDILNRIRYHIGDLGQVLQDTEGAADVGEDINHLDYCYKFIEQTLNA